MQRSASTVWTRIPDVVPKRYDHWSCSCSCYQIFENSLRLCQYATDHGLNFTQTFVTTLAYPFISIIFFTIKLVQFFHPQGGQAQWPPKYAPNSLCSKLMRCSITLLNRSCSLILIETTAHIGLYKSAATFQKLGFPSPLPVSANVQLQRAKASRGRGMRRGVPLSSQLGSLGGES